VGVENTLTLEVEKSENAAALEVLDLVTGIDLFSTLTIEHAREILQTVEIVKFKAGDYVIKKGDEGHSMMIIASGKAEVRVSMLKREDRINEERMADKKGQQSPRLGAGISKASSFKSVGRNASALSQLSIAEAENSDSEEEEEANAEYAAKAAKYAEKDAEKDSRSDLNGVQEEIEKMGEDVQTTVKTFTTGDYFGEQALVAPDCIRSADIIAVTDMTCYQFQRQDFNWLLHGTNVVAKIERMIMARQDAVWDLIGMNSVLRLLTPTQKTQLEQRCMPKYYEQGEYVWEEGGPATIACLIDSGKFKFVTAKNKGMRRRAPSVFRHLGPPPPPQFMPGSFVGEIDALLEDKPLQTTLCAKEAGQVMLISKEDLLEFFTNAPGVLLAMLHTQFVLEEGGGKKEKPKEMKDLKRKVALEDEDED
jgi:CRP-like cAMP-binding protein